MNDEQNEQTVPPHTTVMRRSIVYGSIATPIKKPETEHTHKWALYLRGYNNEDISYYVKKVVFKLHESFVNPNRSTFIVPPIWV
jgi:YEATS domain-containing protein 4